MIPNSFTCGTGSHQVTARYCVDIDAKKLSCRCGWISEPSPENIYIMDPWALKRMYAEHLLWSSFVNGNYYGYIFI